VGGGICGGVGVSVGVHGWVRVRVGWGVGARVEVCVAGVDVVV